MLALHLAVERRPVRLRPAPMTLYGPRLAVEPALQSGVGQIQRQRPCQPRPIEALVHLPQRRARHACSSRRVAHGQAALAGQSQQLAHSAHRNPLRRHRSLQKRSDPRNQRSARHRPRRDQSEWMAASDRNGWRDQIGTGGAITPESAVRPVDAAVHCRWPVWRSRIGSTTLARARGAWTLSLVFPTPSSDRCAIPLV
jgi:hypothetical protein